MYISFGGKKNTFKKVSKSIWAGQSLDRFSASLGKSKWVGDTDQEVPLIWAMPKKGCLFLSFRIYIFLFPSVSLPMDDAVLITAIDDISLHFFLSARLQNTHQPASASCLIMKRKQKPRIFSNILEIKSFCPRNPKIKTTIYCVIYIVQRFSIAQKN